ncbi:MAG: ABC transporter permease [Actinobacteria bacterium]|nr:ABC transporter permease [Actinomycetota bacterium]
MLTAALVELRVSLRNPQLLVVLVAIPLTLVAVLSTALDPIYPTDNPYQSTIPGFAVMFAFYGMAFAADGFLREREWGNWARLLSLPVDRWRIVLGKALAPVAVVSIQLALLLGLGSFAYGVHLGAPVPLTALLLATAVAGCAPGLALASWVRSRVELDQLSNLLVIGMASVGGAIVPATRLPGALARLAPLTPQYWALDGFDRVMNQGAGLAEIGAPLAALLGFAVGVHALSHRAVRWHRLLDPV